MPSTAYAIIIGSGILAFLDGCFLGLMPMKSERLTPSQRTWSQVASLIGMGLVVVLILIGQDTASWAAIAAMIAGIIIGIVPPVKAVMQTRFAWLQPGAESDRSADNKRQAGRRQAGRRQAGDNSSPGGKSTRKS